jgi:hypothetical protein
LARFPTLIPSGLWHLSAQDNGLAFQASDRLVHVDDYYVAQEDRGQEERQLKGTPPLWIRLRLTGNNLPKADKVNRRAS